MKRTFWRKKPTTPLKKTKLARKSKSPIKKLQEELWKECRRVADIKYPPKNGITYCYTCDNPITGSNKQLGHFIPNSISGAYLRYDIRNLRWQCYMCNIHLSGNGSEFYRRLVKEMGQEYVDGIFADKKRSVKAHDHYLSALAEYKNL